MAILGQLMENPQTGYEIKIAFRDTIRNFWHVSDGQLYPSLRSLLNSGMVRKTELTAANGRKKHEYTLTAEGRKEFLEWLRETASPVPEMKEPFLLKLLFFGQLNSEEQAAHIESQIEQASDLIEDYRDVWRDKMQMEENPYVKLVGDAGLLLLEARKLYMEQLRSGLASGNLTSRMPLFDDATLDLGKELAKQLMAMFEGDGGLSIQDLLSFTQQAPED